MRGPVILLSLMACAAPSPPRTVPVAAAPITPDAAARAPVVPPATPAPDAELANLGFPEVPPAPSTKAERALAAGVAALRKHDDATAASSLAQALADAPDLAEAHYQLAIVHTRAARFAAAAAELDALMSADLAITQRIDADPELAALRAAPEGEALRLRRLELERLWTVAIAHGAPLLMFDGEHGSQEILHARVLRPGVWVASVHRFFPIGPAFPDAVAGWVDLANQHAVTVAMQIADCRSDFCPRITGIEVHVVTLAGAPAGAWSYHSGEAHGITVESVPGGARVQVDDCNFAKCRSEWEVIDPKGSHVDPDQHARAGVATLVVDHRGTDLQLPTAGISLAGQVLQLPDHAPVTLDKRFRLTDFHCVEADATHVLVASTLDRCECGEKFEGHILLHEIARVDRRSGRVETVAHGKGMAAATTGRDGDIYVQLAKLERFTSIALVGLGAGEQLPDGILLVPPVGGRDCCGL